MNEILSDTHKIHAFAPKFKNKLLLLTKMIPGYYVAQIVCF